MTDINELRTELDLEIMGEFIGSAYTPQVEVTETSGGHNVAITYDDAETGITTVDFDVLDGEQGPQGIRGPQGETGAAAGFGTPTASVDNNTGTPSVEVTAKGADTAKVFNFAFHNLKGGKGDTGERGLRGETGATGATGAAAGFGTVSATVDNATGTPSVEVAMSGEDTAKNFAFAFHNLKGEQGEPGDVQSDGTYPMLHAGLADALSSTYGETETFTTRTSDYSGAVEIQSILGNTVVENGELVSANIEGITSAGSTLEIPVSTYFPNGMRGAGTAHDALYADHADTVIGAVDLGTLDWTPSQSGPYFKSTTAPSGIKPPVSNSSTANIQCNQYQALPYYSGSLPDVFNTDSSIAIQADSNIGTVEIHDNNLAGSTASEFKIAMSGVMLYYELATPTTTQIDPPLNLTYPVEQGGTESIIVPTGSTSAAPTFVTLYAYDADGIIDKTQSIIAQVESGTASTNYAVNSYLVMRGTLYRVTSAIATGETITPGTNCTATTVMAEIIRLTA